MHDRTVTLPTLDRGSVTLAEPAWCAGHADHRPGHRVDLIHCGPQLAATFHGQEFATACLVQAPFANRTSTAPAVSVSLLEQALDPVSLYVLAAALDSHADQLRELADQLAVLLEEGRA